MAKDIFRLLTDEEKDMFDIKTRQQIAILEHDNGDLVIPVSENKITFLYFKKRTHELIEINL